MSRDKCCLTCGSGSEFKNYTEILCFKDCAHDNPFEICDGCKFYSIMDPDELRIMLGDYVCDEWKSK